MNFSFKKTSGKLGSKLEFKRSELTALFVPFTDIEKVHKALPEDLHKQLEALQDKEKLKTEMKKGAKDSSKHLDHFVMNFTEGGRLFVFAIKKEENTFHRHQRLRKTFHVELSKLKSHQEWILEFYGLDAQMSESLIGDFTSLVHLSPWKNHVFGKKKQDLKTKEAQSIEVHCNLDRKKAETASLRGRVLAEANNLVRELAMLPANYLSPGIYREKVKAYAKEWGLDFEYVDKKKLEKLGAGAFLAVIAADPETEGGIAVLKYKPKKVKKSGHLAFVGKGLCFDTGGYNVKTGNYMFGMHEDMTGSAIALALIKVFSELEIPIEVRSYLALAENHISPLAYKPNDVVMTMNGLSIEVENTDAEGRMVLSDTLAFASKEKPLLLMDFATLTGTCFVALGTARSGVFSKDWKLSNEAIAVGEDCGERVWNFPIGEDYEDGLKSEVADLRQCAPVRGADQIYAATLLGHFVEKDVPWLHIDLASHSHKGGLGLVSTDTNGFGVRFALNFAEKFLKLK